MPEYGLYIGKQFEIKYNRNKFDVDRDKFNFAVENLDSGKIVVAVGTAKFQVPTDWSGVQICFDSNLTVYGREYKGKHYLFFQVPDSAEVKTTYPENQRETV